MFFLNLHAQSPKVIIIGGGPAGLMAAEIVARAGFRVAVYDAMPSVGRKFLLAGVGGMNITHAEAHEQLLLRYGDAAPWLKSYLDSFSATELRQWIHGLGIDTFVGSSGRVFPTDMKAAPLLRAWLHRLRELGVQFFPRHRWLGWADNGDLLFQASEKSHVVTQQLSAAATLLALGGASWQRLGSDGAWVSLLRHKNIEVLDLLPSNCGFEAEWSSHFQQSCAGQPLPTISVTTKNLLGQSIVVRGEAMITHHGIEGTTIYALSAHLRDSILRDGFAHLEIDLLPDFSFEKIVAQLQRPRGKNSMSNFLRKQLNLPAVKIALLRELTPASVWQNPLDLANAIKSLRLRLDTYRPIDEAISTAGGIDQQELTPSLMLKKMPGIFCAGEMLNWEAPTGGYLLTACFATGRAAGFGMVDYLTQMSS